MNELLDRAKKVHLVGIGGSGMSAIARLLLLEGKHVSGSDRDDSKTLDELRVAGARIFVGHRSGNLPTDTDLVVHTIAVDYENPELERAKSMNIKTMTYPEVLGLISKDKFTIAVSGTHGKTTTTAMVGKLLRDAGLDPTVIVGSRMLNPESNLVVGKSKYLVVEACEYRRSFLNIEPNIVVITNIDRDHLDYFGDLPEIQRAFGEFAAKLPSDGALICAAIRSRVATVKAKTKAKVIDYELCEPLTRDFKLRLPGAHNQWNAQAAVAVAEYLNIPHGVIKKSLETFKGTKRRLEYKGKTFNDTLVYDDYGHAPSEIRATLSALRDLYPDKKITIVFQPHLYSRTRLLLGEFGGSFEEADNVIITDIFASREPNDNSIHAKDLVSRINKNGVQKASYIEDFMSIYELMREGELKTDILLVEGAGSVGALADALIKE
ncbi:MAG: UDP-N-acetylmuramate--L-alanine ligase [Candidatus Vogelbacteria bacterium]|nr:UDP-N-acetylmuramate--L-alanine ligase [Candidatus Vogelbacteria bacterium]